MILVAAIKPASTTDAVPVEGGKHAFVGRKLAGRLALNVVVEDAVHILVFVQQSVCVVVGKVFELNQGVAAKSEQKEP